MKKLGLFFFLLIVTCQISMGQIAAWDFTGAGSYISLAATTFNTNLSSSGNITRGAGATASAGANSFRTVGFKNDGIATTNTDYFSITLGAATGFQVSLSTIDAFFAGTGTYCVAPGVTAQFAYSLDGGTTITLIGAPFVLTGSPATMTQIDVSGIAALQNVASGTTITFYYYASGQTTTGGWGFYSSAAGVNGLAIGGTNEQVAAIKTENNNIKDGSISNYPNPTAGQTTVAYSLPQGITTAELVFYNMMGQEVKRYKVTNAFTDILISTTDLEAGTYYYQLQGNGFSAGKKMVVIK